MSKPAGSKPAGSKIAVQFVCTGNICRSPMAEGVLRTKLAAEGLAPRVEVESAGLGNWHVGEAPDSRAIRRAAARGYNIRAQRARLFAARDFGRLDLILGMDRGHARALSRRRPPGPCAAVHLFLELAGEVRGHREVPDPYYGDLTDYDFALDLIEPGVEGLIAVLKRDYL